MSLRLQFAGLALASLLALAPTQAGAISFLYDFTGPHWLSPDFVGVGSAFWANDGALTPPTRLRLTCACGGQVGNAWLATDEVDAGQAWSAEFTWQITFEGGGGADGLGFHLQETGTGANTFFNGAGLTANSFLSVGIDTWNNGGGAGDNFDFALDLCLVNKVDGAVDALQQRRLSRIGRSDDAQDRLFRDR